MRAKVTQRGVLVPKRMLHDAEEVEIHEEGGRVVIEPVYKDDPIIGLGSSPVSTGVKNAASEHDAYLYGRTNSV